MSRGKIARKVSKARIAITYYQLCMQYLPRPIRDKSDYESALERILFRVSRRLAEIQ